MLTAPKGVQKTFTGKIVFFFFKDRFLRKSIRFFFERAGVRKRFFLFSKIYGPIRVSVDSFSTCTKFFCIFRFPLCVDSVEVGGWCKAESTGRRRIPELWARFFSFFVSFIFLFAANVNEFT